MDVVCLPRPRLSWEGRTVAKANAYWGYEPVARACPGLCMGPDRGGFVDIGPAEVT